MILGCEELADCHCGLHSWEVPVSSGDQPLHPCACSLPTPPDSKRSSCTLPTPPDSKRSSVETKTDGCGLPPSADVTGSFRVDLSTTKPPDGTEVSGAIVDFCGNSEGIDLYIDLPCSPNTEFAKQVACSDTQNTPVNNRRSGFASQEDIATEISPLTTRFDCLECRKRSEIPWSPLSSAKHNLEIPLDEVRDELLDAHEASVSRKQEMLETVLSLEMPKPTATQDGLEEHIVISRAEREVLLGPDLPRNSHELLIVPGQGQLSSTDTEKSEMKLVPNLWHHCRAAGESLDNLPCLKRRRLTTANVSEMQERRVALQKFQMSPLSLKGGMGETASCGQVEGQPGPDSPICSNEELGSPNQEDSTRLPSISIANDVEMEHCLGRNGAEVLVLPDVDSQSMACYFDLERRESDRVDVDKSQIFTPSLKQSSAGPAIVAGEDRGFAGSVFPSVLSSGSDDRLKMVVSSLVPCGIIETPKVSKFSLNERLVGQERGIEEAEGPGDPKMATDEVDLHLSLEKSESRIPAKGTFALRALIETDDVQKLKRMRMTTLENAPAVGDCVQKLDDKSSANVAAQPSDGSSASRKSDRHNGLLARFDSDGVHRASRCPPRAANGQEMRGKDLKRSGYLLAEKSLSGRMPPKSNFKAGGQAFDTLDKYLARPPKPAEGARDVHVPKRGDWLVLHYSGNADTGIRQNSEFGRNVGKNFSTAIDQRPPAVHPGFVGDGNSGQLCRVCGEMEDSTSSLICDSCEELFHMTCVNSRMKIVPRVDEWVCRQCKRKRKMHKEGENQGDSDHGGEPKDWWRDDSGIGKVEKELLRMSNGRRTKVRIGPKYQADVPDVPDEPQKIGVSEEVNQDDNNLGEPISRFGQEVPLTAEEKQHEQDQAEYNLANNIWPLRWLPASCLTPGPDENWIQCTVLLLSKGEISPEGWKADKDIICGKWRRAPHHIFATENWECSCAIVWDPRHADCAVPQEISSDQIGERLRANACTT